MGLESERRKRFRIPLQVPVHHRIASRDWEDSIALDIHQDGLFMLSEVLPDIGTPVSLNFTIPGTDQLIRVKGNVRWVINRQPRHEPGTGIKFERPVSFSVPVEFLSQYMDNNTSVLIDYARHPFYPEIQQLKNLNSHILNSVKNGVIILDHEFVVTNYNAKQCVTLIPEKQKVIGRPIWEVTNFFNLRYNGKTFKDILGEVLTAKTYKIKNIPYEAHLEDNTSADKSNSHYLDLELKPIFNVNGAVSGILIVAQDVSKDRQWASREKDFESILFEQLRHSSVGLMIDTILTSMVNPLSAILGRLELLNLEMQAAKNNLANSSDRNLEIKQIDEYIEELRMIGHNVRTLIDLCRNFMTRRKKEQDTMPRLLNLNDIIMDEIKSLEMNLKFRDEVSRKLALAKNLPPIWGNYVDFSQLIFILLNHCIEAMKLSDKKEMFISTGFKNNAVYLDIKYSGITSRQTTHNHSIFPSILDLFKKRYGFDLSVQEQFGDTIYSLLIPVSENSLVKSA